MNDFKVSKNGTALIITLGRSLNTTNAPALQEEYFAKQRLGNKPEIVFVNCAKEIYNTLKMIGLASAIKFLKVENKKVVRSQESLEEFAANNDVVCYSMKMGQDYD